MARALLESMFLNAGLSDLDTEVLTQAFARRRLDKEQLLARQGQEDAWEYLLLSGRVALETRDAKGREVCLGLFEGPAVLAPQISRSWDGQSLVDIRALSDLEVAVASVEALQDLMVRHPGVRNWGNAQMQAILQAKAEREWALSALGGAARLAWFREAFPGYEARFAHGLIASYLGMTPVSLSRLRNKVGV